VRFLRQRKKDLLDLHEHLSGKVFQLPENIFRSGVPHAVETNLVTRNAINPRHAFSDDNANAIDALADSAELASHSANHADEVDGPVVAGEHLTDNLQALDKTNVTDNWQSLGKAHLQDNLQGMDSVAFHDNRQSLGPSQSIQEQKLYLEKKSIRDNRQKVTSTVSQRAAPTLTAHVSASPVQSSTPPSRVNPTTGKHDQAAVAGVSQPTEDDELRARMKKLKATVRDVSDTLSELAPKP
jgi:hypothetical protein